MVRYNIPRHLFGGYDIAMYIVDINWTTRDARSSVTQLMSCNWFVNPWRMRKGYSSRFVCVCVCLLPR